MSSLPIQDALAPFSGVADPENDDHPPDFILRSCDGFDFHVHRDILKFASDCFEGMFAIPGGDGDPSDLRRDGKPVLVMPESQVALHRLLCLAYPPQTLQHYTLASADLDTFLAVNEAAQKYQFLRVRRIMKELMSDLLSNPAIIDAQPHRLFAIARLCGFHELARKVALSLLKNPLSHDFPAFPEMKLLTWDDGHSLYRFHQRCVAKAKEIVVQKYTAPLTVNDASRA
ncbi:hypothetical protein B0H13DRAFT_2058144 [Mycena leptocephala]|nr:hypothetical protein B0H13DRAFT_2058144 [Mycena leptocephala]